MRNTLPLLSRAHAPSASSPLPSMPESFTITPPQPVPTIRLISATPSANGSASDASMSFSSAAPFSSSPLAPRSDSQIPRKRIVPKKSKLGLLGGGGKSKDKGNKDLSDVVRRIGGNTASTGRSGFEIYVDQTEDPDLAEIVVVKKKKSRLGLDGMKWGALGEVTNVPRAPKEQSNAPVEHLLKVKGDDSQKWWSIGRGRKDSKQKEKENENAKVPARSKTPEPAKSLDARARFNSLDSGVVLCNPAPRDMRQTTTSLTQSAQPATLSPAFTHTEAAPKATNGFLAPEADNAGGSIAVRAIKSMRSLARMASWAQLSNNAEKDGEEAVKPKTAGSTKVKVKENEKEKGEGKKKKKKEKNNKEEKERTVRWSGSSFEAGAPSVQASPLPPVAKDESTAKTLGRRKQSILGLGLGLPSTMRGMGMATVRNTSSSSFVGQPQPPSRLSVDSAHLIMNAQGRPSSVVSNGSSLRPPSTASGASMFSKRSKDSSSSSVVSVRWDEAGLRSSKEMQRNERRTREKEGKTTRAGKESKRSSEGRRRAAIVEIFPETQAQMSRPTSLASGVSIFDKPIVTVQEATLDGHSVHTEESATETPIRRNRPRPVSEQMLGRTRPQPVYDEGEGMLSMLDAVTNDLASLINRLDLEATPGSTNGSPIKPSPVQRVVDDSPIKRRTIAGNSPIQLEPRESTASIQSLRPYAQAQSAAAGASQQPFDPRRLIGQQIAPWSELNWQVSPKKGPTSTIAPRPTHKRTLTPTPVPDLPFAFQPLRPAKTKTPLAVATSPASGVSTPPINSGEGVTPSSATFGSRPSKFSLNQGYNGPNEAAPSPTPVFRRSAEHVRKPSSLASKLSQKSIRMSPHRASGIAISPEARKGLGLAGTMGGDPSTEPPVDPEDPDSDIPDELQVILSGQSDDECTRRLDDTLSSCHNSTPTSPISPPELSFPLPLPEVLPALPALQLYDEEANHADIDEGGNSSLTDDDTKKSFDFTGELQKLNESGGSDRRSFVEQLENAFRTPARIELDYGLGEQLGLNDGFLAVPPVPRLPSMYRQSPPEDIAPRSVSNPVDDSALYENSDEAIYRDSCVSDDISFGLTTAEDECRVYPASKRSGSMRSKPSDGQLNVDFKFGGKATVPPIVEEKQEKPLTLSDIIPPLSHLRNTSRSSILEEDSSVLKSIMAKAVEVPPLVPRRRALSDSSSKISSRAMVQAMESVGSRSAHSRRSSELSFAGFESFDEVRRGFEFGPDRPAFYPPPGAATSGQRRAHARELSIYSIASVSSYGATVDSGLPDPFGYLHNNNGLNRPPSCDMSTTMSMSVDDTFSFIHRGRRQRIDSDASSFYFHAPGTGQVSQSHIRGHRRHESGISVTSNAPPVSLYNRSFGGHRRGDSNTSVSSMAYSYALHGANGGRAAWARHRQDLSVDSSWSEYSAQRLGRPGLGDKMFDHEHGMPLATISASPPESVADGLRSRGSYDSFDGKRSSADDSLFENSEYRTSMSSDSVFGHDGSYSQVGKLPPRQYRPVSVISELSTHSPRKEDDTMITMLDGGHVRRLSVNSMIGASPCVRVEKRKQSTVRAPQPPSFRQDEPEVVNSVNKSRLVEKPSIASTSSHQFGGERMIMARKGLLERQSLEDSALIAQGEDLLASLRSQSIFSRPEPVSRSRSSTVTSSSGAETPPLSTSDGSSVSGDSQSSIDIGHLDALLLNTTFPSSGIARARARARARGAGHRRRISQARASRSSVYETIQEESSPAKSPSPVQVQSPQMAVSPLPGDSIFIVDGDDDSGTGDWDDERGITTLRRYYALKGEAEETVTESKRVWPDTAFSIFAVQSFRPPQNGGAMRAMLEHSQTNYGPLPSELRPRRIRSRTSSRASPYPLPVMRSSLSPEKFRPSSAGVTANAPPVPSTMPSMTSVLREVSVNANTDNVLSPPPALGTIKPFTPFAVEFEKPKHGKVDKGLPVPARLRVTSSARRTALGWSKRSTGKSSSSDQKENISQGMLITPSESLRINRPRPRGRPAPARVFAQS